jgi:hypothetical protein
MSDTAANSFKDLKNFANSDAFEAKLKWVQQHWDDPIKEGKNLRQHQTEIFNHRAGLLRELANSSLRNQGIPQLKGTDIVKGAEGSSFNFQFSPADWTMGIDERILKLDAKDIVQDVEFGRIGGLVYHEIRHTQQFYWMAVERSRNPNSPLPPGTKRMAPEVEAGVPPSIMHLAQADKRQFTPVQQQLVQQLYAENSPYEDQSGTSPRKRNDEPRPPSASYFSLVRENDAYDAHRYIRQSFDITEFYNERPGLPENRKLDLLRRPQKKSETPSLDFVSEISNDSTPRINFQQRLAELYQELGVTTSADGIPRTTLRDPRVVHEELSRALEEFSAAVNQIPSTVAPIQSRDFKLVRLSGPEPRSLESESGSFERVLAQRWQNSIQASLQRQAEQQQQGDSGLDLGGLGE